MSRIIFFDFSLNGLQALFCCRSAWRSCRWRWLPIFCTSSRTREFSACVTTACGNPDTLNSMSIPVLSQSASTSLSVSLSFSKRSTNNLVFLQSREKRVSISWALERDVCSVKTGRPVLWIGLGFAYVGWEPSACRKTSEPILLRKFDVNPKKNLFWCFFHAVCMYCARRGAFRPIVSGSLCSLSIGFTSRKNTVCLLLRILASRYQSWIDDGL